MRIVVTVEMAVYVLGLVTVILALKAAHLSDRVSRLEREMEKERP